MLKSKIHKWACENPRAKLGYQFVGILALVGVASALAGASIVNIIHHGYLDLLEAAHANEVERLSTTIEVLIDNLMAAPETPMRLPNYVGGEP